MTIQPRIVAATKLLGCLSTTLAVGRIFKEMYIVTRDEVSLTAKSFKVILPESYLDVTHIWLSDLFWEQLRVVITGGMTLT